MGAKKVDGVFEMDWIHLLVFLINFFEGVPLSLFKGEKNVDFVFIKNLTKHPEFWASGVTTAQFGLDVVGDFGT